MKINTGQFLRLFWDSWNEIEVRKENKNDHPRSNLYVFSNAKCCIMYRSILGVFNQFTNEKQAWILPMSFVYFLFIDNFCRVLCRDIPTYIAIAFTLHPQALCAAICDRIIICLVQITYILNADLCRETRLLIRPKVMNNLKMIILTNFWIQWFLLINYLVFIPWELVQEWVYF